MHLFVFLCCLLLQTCDVIWCSITVRFLFWRDSCHPVWMSLVRFGEVWVWWVCYIFHEGIRSQVIQNIIYHSFHSETDSVFCAVHKSDMICKSPFQSQITKLSITKLSIINYIIIILKNTWEYRTSYILPKYENYWIYKMINFVIVFCLLQWTVCIFKKSCTCSKTSTCLKLSIEIYFYINVLCINQL